jgi:hypothetical protein
VERGGREGKRKVESTQGVWGVQCDETQFP